jgi:uncharacterized membrane protein YedE/YeeE
VTVVAPGPINTEVDTRYIGIVIGGAAAFAAGIVLGAFVVAWIKQRRLRE